MEKADTSVLQLTTITPDEYSWHIRMAFYSHTRTKKTEFNRLLLKQYLHYQSDAFQI
jgi:hypothetical protein